MTQSCKNCKHAELHRSNKKAGECKAPSPISTDIPHPASMLIRVSRYHVWPDDGTKCAAWSPK